MKKTSYIITLFVMSGICLGCASSRNTDRQRQIDYSGELQRLQSSVNDLKTEVNKHHYR